MDIILKHENTINSEKILDLSSKSLTLFPKFNMTALQLLYLGNNDLKELPENLFNEAPMLKWLDVRNNQIENIPLSIRNHNNIETLLLQNNKISYLPCELSTAKKLKYIQLNGNPIIQPKRSIIKLGTEAILKHLYLQYDQKKSTGRILYDDKLIDVSLKQYDNIKTDNLDNRETKIQSHNPMKKNRNPEVIATKSGWNNIQLPKIKLLNDDTLKTNEKQRVCKNSHGKYLKNSVIKTKEEQVISINNNLMRDIWMEKKKEILSRREKVIQDKKSLLALKNWRNHYKNMKLMNPNTYYALNLSNIPYDTDLDYVKILTRADLEKDLPDKYKKNISTRNAVSKTKSKEKMNLQTKIAEMLEEVQTIRSENYDWTPRTERKIIGCKIRKLTDLTNKLKSLKSENDKTT